MNSTRDLTYPKVVEELGLQACIDPKAPCNLFGLEQHNRGYVKDGVVHFRDRDLTRRGLWNFLRLVGRLMAPTDVGTYERIWREDSAAYDLGLSLGVRFPREYADTDRARVRAAIAARAIVGGDTRTKMERWARE